MLKGIAISVGFFIIVTIGWTVFGGISGTVSYEEKPEIDIYELEREIHSLTNHERHPNKLLSYDAKLSNIARQHSQDMVNRNYFDHTSPEGKEPTDRGLANGYKCHKNFGSYYTEGLGENIFQNNLYDSYTTLNGVISGYDWNTSSEIAKSTVDGWMESPGHRENILESDYDRMGIGVAISDDSKVLITQMFC